MFDKIIQFVTSSAGVLTTILTAVLTAAASYYFTKRGQLEADERRLKEKYYLAFIHGLNENVLLADRETAMDNLAYAQNQLLLIGSADVVKSLMDFHDYVKISGQGKQKGPEEHNRLLTELLKAMRKDLYKRKSSNSKYPIIHLTGNN